MDLKEKFIPINENSLIYCRSSFGPSFGQNDFDIRDKCNSNSNSHADFPDSYNRACGEKIVREKASSLINSMFGDLSEGKNMKIVEYEVFVVKH